MNNYKKLLSEILDLDRSVPSPHVPSEHISRREPHIKKYTFSTDVNGSKVETHIDHDTLTNKSNIEFTVNAMFGRTKHHGTGETLDTMNTFLSHIQGHLERHPGAAITLNPVSTEDMSTEDETKDPHTQRSKLMNRLANKYGINVGITPPLNAMYTNSHKRSGEDAAGSAEDDDENTTTNS